MRLRLLGIVCLIALLASACGTTNAPTTAAVETALGGQATTLRKPFDMETLAQTIAGLLGGAAP